MTEWQDYITHMGGHAHTVAGDLKIWSGLWSPQRRNRRDILVYLPPSYSQQDRRYPVIYMHDGQNLFDRMTSFAGEWEVDETMLALSREGLEAIVVGIANAGVERLNEYSPFYEPGRGGGQGEQYLEFIVKTLKPLIDQHFRTLRERTQTGLIGSSLGGLISLYAFFRYPAIFGWVGAMSPSLWFARHAIFPFVEKASFVTGKIYLDRGTQEPMSRPNVQDLYRLLRRKGYVPRQSLLYVEEKGAAHQEMAWARRLPGAIRFLLRP